MPKEKIKKIECYLCGQDNDFLIQIKAASDTWDSPHGICTKCFKNGDLDKNVFIKEKKYIVEQIESAKERIKFWTEELKKLK